MAISLVVAAAISFLHIFAFVFAVGAEMRRNTGTVVPDEYDERLYCLYGSDAATTYAISAVGLLVLSHLLLNLHTRCFCFNRSRSAAGSRKCAVVSYIISWLSFLTAGACLLAGAARNAYHTKYVGDFIKKDLSSCATLRKGIFATAAALILISLLSALSYCWAYSKSDPTGWQKHENEGEVGMADLDSRERKG